jgi:O-antigen/teichoic acid export membrane protein
MDLTAVRGVLARRIRGVQRRRLIWWIGPHGRRAMTLVGGASAAQLIPVAIAPFLTRLYEPADFGLLAAFASITAVFVAVAAGRYSVAIMLPDNDRDAVQVTGLALVVTAGTTALLLLAAFATLAFGGDLGIASDLGYWLCLIPVTVFASAAFEALSHFALRKDRIGDLARANVVKAAATGGAQLSLGCAGAGLGGLIGGSLVGLATGNGRLTRIYRGELRRTPLSMVDMRRVAARYSHFPKFDVWSNLANILSYNLLILAVGWIYGSAVLGQYSIAVRFAALPSVLLGVAMGQVYLREAARRVGSPASALRAFNRTVGVLSLFSVIPMLAIAFWGPDIFSWLFGQEWRAAGTYAACMVPLLWVRFIVSPLTSAYHVYGRQRVLLMFQLLLLATVLVTTAAATLLDWSLPSFILIQSSSMAALYVVILLVAHHTIASSPTGGRPGGSPERESA